MQMKYCGIFLMSCGSGFEVALVVCITNKPPGTTFLLLTYGLLVALFLWLTLTYLFIFLLDVTFAREGVGDLAAFMCSWLYGVFLSYF